ncbi:hypothetical protein ABZW18_32670 [Streptomyces sp. NPDC004647]|uniref:hypothetical protein n=1 Tax=Streptomyces sp. NPDC004647 TaxID=3154671 RepID=UPI0033AD44D6
MLAFNDLNTDDEVKAFHLWRRAQSELRKAEQTLARAATDRAVTLERLVNLTGSQEKAGKIVRLNQSSVSSSLRPRRTI